MLNNASCSAMRKRLASAKSAVRPVHFNRKEPARGVHGQTERSQDIKMLSISRKTSIRGEIIAWRDEELLESAVSEEPSCSGVGPGNQRRDILTIRPLICSDMVAMNSSNEEKPLQYKSWLSPLDHSLLENSTFVGPDKGVHLLKMESKRTRYTPDTSHTHHPYISRSFRSQGAIPKLSITCIFNITIFHSVKRAPYSQYSSHANHCFFPAKPSPS